MCLIITKGDKPALLPRDVFDHVYMRNNDGYGAMWVEDGRVQHFKRLGMTKDEIYSSMEEMSERHESVVFHMRLKTHGNVTPGLCHPFRILNKSRHGKDLFMMHNGIINGFTSGLKAGQSDTTKFKDDILIPLLTRNPDALDDESIFASIEKLTSGSRLIFLDSNGKVYITSKTSWNNRYGLTLSNTYMLPATGNYGTHTPTGSNVTSLHDRKDDKGDKVWRIVNGVGMWVWLDKFGYCKTVTGTMYKDGGSACHVPTNPGLAATKEDELDDDLPFEPDTKKENKGKSETQRHEERCRYARIVHNTHDGDVCSREQMLADILGMNDKELFELCGEDPEAATIFISEMYDIIMEFNSLLREEEPTMCFDEERLLELGSLKHHQDSMQAISKIRKERYAEMIKNKVNKDKKEVA